MQRPNYFSHRWRKPLHTFVCVCVMLSSLFTAFTLAPSTAQAARTTDTESYANKMENARLAPVAHAPNAPVTGANSGQIKGTVFQDYNSNGVMDTAGDTTNPAIDRGVAGVTVTAYDKTGSQVGTTSTVATGAYTITGVIDGAAYRVEFSNLPAGYESSYHNSGTGTTSGTSVQFVTGGSGNVSFGINRPIDYAQNNPTLVAVRNIDPTVGPGNPPTGVFDASSPTLVTFPANAGSTNSTNNNVPASTNLTLEGSTGALFGLQYARTTKMLYASSLMKRITRFGPGGPTAIYKINAATGAVVATYVVGGPATDWHQTSNYLFDYVVGSTNGITNTWDAVGKSSLGGIALSDDEQSLYTVNLENRTLYQLNAVSGAAVANAAIPNATLTSCPGGAAGDFRPFAMHFYKGKLYMGATCTAQSSQNAASLRARVYEVDPTTLSVGTLRMDTPLNYLRQDVAKAQLGAWNAWDPDGCFTGREGPYISCPQPLLTDLDFVGTDIVLGIRDRFGDQSGNQTPRVPGMAPAGEGTNNDVNGIAGGDLLRGTGTAATGWSVINMTYGAGSATEFYTGEAYVSGDNPFHNETALGALTYIPGYATIHAQVYDPVIIGGGDVAWDYIFRSGLRQLDNTTGAAKRGYVYNSTFGKALPKK